jgi:hypothetical protein
MEKLAVRGGQRDKGDSTFTTMSKPAGDVRRFLGANSVSG